MDGGETGLPLSHYLWILRRHGGKIAMFVVAVVLATVIVSVRLTPVYESTATVYVDRGEAKNIVGRESETGTFPSLDAEQFLATQVRMIQSDSVVRPIAQRYDLLEKEKLGGKDPAEKAKVADAPIELRKLRVTRPPNTYLIQIAYRSTDPQLAADVANGIANSYLDHTYNIRTKSSVNLSRYMEKQTEELRAKMEDSSQRLAQMERELNVVDPEDKTNILSKRLMELNTDFARAQTDLVRARAAYDAISGGSLEAVLLSGQADSLKRLIDRRNELNEKFAEVKAHFGPNHPEYKKWSAQVKALDEDIDRSRQRIVKQAEVEYAQAQQRESLIKRNLEDTKAESDRLNLRSFDYRRAKQEAEADKRLYDELVRKIREAGINASFQNNAVRISDPARPGWKPVFPNIRLNMLLAFVFATLLGVGAAILSDTLDNTIRDPEQVTRTINTHVIGSLPALKDLRQLQIPINRPDGQPASGAIVSLAARGDRQMTTYDEAVRTLRSSVLLMDFDRRIRTLLMSSATRGEGKSTTASHLAYSHAEQKKRTLLVDCDLRRPSQHKIFDVPTGTGLSNVLNGESSWRDARLKLESNPYLDLITAGPPSRRAADFLGSVMPSLIEEMGKEYDLIILDGPPLLGFAESLQMAAAADGVIVVTKAGETSRRAVATAVQTLERLRANVVGLVLNQVKRGHSDHYYYYGYYGKYYKRYYGEAAKGVSA
jgi:capsular exopolysaccharide synthesis family protein